MTERISVPFWTDPITGVRPPEPNSGMTLRDYFAAKAMQAIISVHDNTTLEFVSGKAYQYADAMMKVREP